MGEWIDVYTDDLLPYNEDIERVYGAHSKDKDIVWVPLMEKALARLCGGYKLVRGDQANAFALITGGLVEALQIMKRDAKDEILPSESVFNRIKEALHSGSLVLTCIDEREANSRHLKGLATNHCYSIHEAINLKHGNETAKLLRVRNPWGETNKVKPVSENGERKGRWSFESPEWKEVNEGLRKRYNIQFEDGGEFWICVEDFYKIFERIYIADVIPNFDEDGFRKADQLNKVVNILGEWHGETAAGNNVANIFKNPRFLLVIPNRGLDRDHRMSVVLQLILQYDHPVKDNDNKDHLCCRLDLFRVETKHVRDNRLHACLTNITNIETYVASRENTYRYKMNPGKYLIVPNYLDGGSRRHISQPFCVRVFTPTAVMCREFLDNPVALTGKPCKTFEGNGSTPRNEAVRLINVFGEWTGDTAAGSDPVNRLKNPRFILTIPGNRKINISLQLRYSRDIDVHCRLDLFKVDDDVVRDRSRWMVINLMTNMTKFMAGGEASYEYELESGKYLLLPMHTEKERINGAFCIRILTHTQVKCRPQTEKPVFFIRTAENFLKNGDQTYNLGKIDCLFGEWVKDRTAGGQISNSSFNKNPQYGLTVEGKAPQPILIDLLQEAVSPTYSIGCYIIKISEGQSCPLDTAALIHGTRVETTEGRTHHFVQHAEASGHYMLSPGRYVVLVFADKPTNEKKFALVIAAQKQSKINITEPK